MASFSDLPIDIAELIVKKANNLSDFLNRSAICKEWRSVALPFNNCLPCKIPRSLLLPLERPFPVLLIPSALSTDTHSFYSITERKTYNHDLVVPEISKSMIVGSTLRGVLIKKGDTHIELVNPFTREQLPLPPIPSMLDLFIELPYTNAIVPLDFDAQQVRSSMVLVHSSTLYYCSGVKKWNELKLPFKIMDSLSHKGMLYFVPGPGEELFAVDVNSPQKITKMALIPEELESHQNHNRWVFVVESLGDLLLIIMLWRPNQTTMFRVFRLAAKTSSDEHKGNSNSPTHTLLEVESLHGRILFLGVHQNSFTLDASLHSGSKDNCIYFSAAWHTDLYDDDRLSWRRVHAGVFHMQDKTTEYFRVNDGYMLNPIWLCPNFNALV